MAVNEEQVIGWLVFLDEFEAILQGKKLIPHWRFDEGILDENGNTTVWEDKFATEEDALAEAIASIRIEGIWSFVHEDDEEYERATVH